MSDLTHNERLKLHAQFANTMGACFLVVFASVPPLLGKPDLAVALFLALGAALGLTCQFIARRLLRGLRG